MTQPDRDRLPAVGIRLLDGFGLMIDNRMTPVIPSSQRILAYLALHERPVDRGVLAGALWPGIPGQRAAARLRSALWRLVRSPCRLLSSEPGTLGLASSVTVDVVAVRRFAAQLATPEPLRTAAPPVSLSAELLPGWTEQWVTVERDWFGQLCLRTLEALSERFRAIGDHFHAHETAEAAVRRDPLRESAHRKLIELHLADNNPAAAVRQYSSYRARLRAELGLRPSPEIHRLLEPLLAARGLR
jgi:DNA-binding SARP family transcriptional activator